MELMDVMEPMDVMEVMKGRLIEREGSAPWAPCNRNWQ